jgi:hypothetical protein
MLSEFQIFMIPVAPQAWVHQTVAYKCTHDNEDYYFLNNIMWIIEGIMEKSHAIPKAGGKMDDIPTDLDVLAIDQLLAVVDRVEGLTVTVGVSDVFRWNWGAKETYSAQSYYLGMFHGSIEMASVLQVWKSRARAKCRFFLWLALHDRCWTTYKLERCGLPHPSACPFYDQAQESITHWLGCVLARTAWAACLRWWDRENRLPPQGVLLADWLQSSRGRATDVRDHWTGVVLICWCL